jgi:hypothetical protein
VSFSPAEDVALAAAAGALESKASSLTPSQSMRAYRFLEFGNQVPQPYLRKGSNHPNNRYNRHNRHNNKNMNNGNRNRKTNNPFRDSSKLLESFNLPSPPSAYTGRPVASHVEGQKLPPLKVEPKPLREAQIEAYKVIEQLEANAEQLINSAKSSLITGGSHVPSPQSQQQYPSHHHQPQQQYQSQSLKYPSLPEQSLSYGSSLFSSNSHDTKGGRRPPPPQFYQPQQQYSLSNAAVGGSNYIPSEGVKTIGLPVKEVTKDYITLPVAVETDDDKVLTQADINEIEKEVLKVIPETLGQYADKIPDSVYDNALPVSPESPRGPRHNTIELPPVVVQNGGHHGNPWPSFPGFGGSFTPGMPRIPAFMSAFSPSKGKISDLLRPLLRKVRPPSLPASPAHQIKGGSSSPDVPVIPSNAPYSGSGHRPENLDVIHLIANQKRGQPAVIHVNQLVRSPLGSNNPSPSLGGEGFNMESVYHSPPHQQLNHVAFYPPPQPYQGPQMLQQFPTRNRQVPPVSFSSPSSFQNNVNYGNNNFGNNGHLKFNDNINSNIGVPLSNPAGGSHSSFDQGYSYEIVSQLDPSSSGEISYSSSQQQPRQPSHQEIQQQQQHPPPPSSYGHTFEQLSSVRQHQQNQEYQHQAPQQQVPQQTVYHQTAPLESNYGNNYPDKSQNNNNVNLNGPQQQQSTLNFRPQNEYIEVVNLPSGGGGQSVVYNPPERQPHLTSSSLSGSSYETPSSQEQGPPGLDHAIRQQQQQQQLHQNQGSYYTSGPGNSGEIEVSSGNHGQSQESYSSGGAPLSLQNQQQTANSYEPSQGGQHQQQQQQQLPQQLSGSDAGAVIEYLDGASVQPVFNPNAEGNPENANSNSGQKETNVVTLNNYKQTVSSLDPKTLVELIAKQVPSLREVLSPSSGGQGQQQHNRQQSASSPGSKDSYEIIEMPPKYHTVDESTSGSSASSSHHSQGSSSSLEDNYYIHHSAGGSSPITSAEEQPDYSGSSDTKDYVDAQGQASMGDHTQTVLSATDQVTKNNNDYLEETASSIQDQAQTDHSQKESSSSQHHQNPSKDHKTDNQQDQDKSKNQDKDKDLPSKKYGQRLKSESSSSTTTQDEDDEEELIPEYTQPLPVSRLKVQEFNGLLVEPSTNATSSVSSSSTTT